MQRGAPAGKEGRGGGQGVQENTRRSDKAAKNRRTEKNWAQMEGNMKGGTLANFLHFLASSGHVGAGGRTNDQSNIFLRILGVEAFLG